MERIIEIDKSVFWWVNSHHTDWLDWTMWVFSQSWSWLIVIVLAYYFTTIRHDRRSWLWVLAGIGICFLLADKISTDAIKDGVQRLRPCFSRSKCFRCSDVSQPFVWRETEYGKRRTECGKQLPQYGFALPAFCVGNRNRIQSRLPRQTLSRRYYMRSSSGTGCRCVGLLCHFANKA